MSKVPVIWNNHMIRTTLASAATHDATGVAETSDNSADAGDCDSTNAMTVQVKKA